MVISVGDGWRDSLKRNLFWLTLAFVLLSIGSMCSFFILIRIEWIRTVSSQWGRE